ncbi:hypothetical protein CY91_03995 [Dehalococcoides mccartyi]|uniref:hypothetical protein n=1 Tax=Dehalococcoides mccartyi TaxID=61435 RepID=UPI0002B767CE|nr:hypothetical protein [Dehalococcoides mccartyi]AGG07172.1 putative membrane protein [Dehalococcoides mccartyi BTF08]KSV16471.1 hypothetical protein CY91_03995 [Dehalococcoides mccartyi]
MNTYLNPEKNRIPTGLTLAVIGSVWGLLEMALGGFLHAIHFANQGAVMGGLAISLMAIFLSITKKPALVPLLGIIAASFKPFSAFIFGEPVFSAYVINPAIAIIMEAVAFGAIAFIFKKAMEKHLFAQITTGFLAGALGIVLYAVIASVFGLGKWPMLDMAGKLDTIVSTGLPVALAGTITLAAGYYLGKFGMPKLANFKTNYPRLYYVTSAAAVVSCWVIPAVFHLGG